MPLWSLPAIKMSWYFLLALWLNFITVEYLRIISWSRHWFKTAVKDIRFVLWTTLQNLIFLFISSTVIHEYTQNGHLTPAEAEVRWTSNPTEQKSQARQDYKHLFQLLLVLCAASTLHSHFFGHLLLKLLYYMVEIKFLTIWGGRSFSWNSRIQENVLSLLLYCKISLFRT